jgi:hypothetical protein
VQCDKSEKPIIIDAFAISECRDESDIAESLYSNHPKLSLKPCSLDKRGIIDQTSLVNTDVSAIRFLALDVVQDRVARSTKVWDQLILKSIIK